MIWLHRGATHALCRDDPFRMGQTICQYVRWSESAAQYVDMHGKELGTDLEKAKQQVEAEAMG